MGHNCHLPKPLTMGKIPKFVVFVMIIIGMFSLIRHIQKTNFNLQFQKIEVKSTEAKLKYLNQDYDDLLKSKTKDSERLKQLENEKKELEEQLQAKLELQKEAERKVATASFSSPVFAEALPPPAGTVEAIIRQAAIKHGLDPDWFVRLAMCESGLNPNAVNYTYYENGHPSGLFQHLSGYWPSRAAAHGYSGASVFDAVANSNVTAAMWATGSHLWECQ